MRSESLACGQPAPDGLQISLAAWAKIIETTECSDFLSFCGRRLSGGSHIQARQCEALARVAMCEPETARLWIKGDSQPAWSRMMRITAATRATYPTDDAMRADFLGGA